MELQITDRSCNSTTNQNCFPNSLNLGLFDKKAYNATLNAKLEITIPKIQIMKELKKQ